MPRVLRGTPPRSESSGGPNNGEVRLERREARGLGNERANFWEIVISSAIDEQRRERAQSEHGAR